MNQLIAFFQLIRWRNLFIVVLTQWMVWQFLLLPLAIQAGENLFLKPFHLCLLICSTLFIAAAGYLINDYYDIQIDLINKPHKVIIGEKIKKSTVLFLYGLLNLFGLLLAIYLSLKLNAPFLCLFHLVIILLLWLYSFKLKKELIIGNLVVSLLVAFTILILPVFEPNLYHLFNWQSMFGQVQSPIFNPALMITGYTFFAFMLTWIREIIKDMEDLEGDLSQQCKTMPIQFGLKKSGAFLTILGFLTVIPLILAATEFIRNQFYVAGFYLVLLLIFPMFYFLFYFNKHQGVHHYKKSSSLLKMLMISGLSFLIIYSFSCHSVG